jgi:hypothetical protein
VTMALILSPVGALLAGPALASTSLGWVLLVTLATNTFVGLALAVAGLRHRSGGLTEEPGLVVDREDEASRTGVPAGVARRRD